MNAILAIVALTLIAVLAALISLRISLRRGARSKPEPDLDTDLYLDAWDEIETPPLSREGIALVTEGALEQYVAVQEGG